MAQISSASAGPKNTKNIIGTCRQTSDDRRVEMLLLRLEEEEHIIIKTVGRYLTEAGSTTLDLLCPPADTDVLDRLASLTKKKPPRRRTVDDTLSMAMRMDAILFAYYQSAAKGAPIPWLREALENLAYAVLEKKKRVVRNAAAVLDM